MVTGAHFQRSALLLKQFSPELIGESQISIKNYRGWHSMQLKNMRDKQLGHLSCLVRMSQ
jgi:hypothetical protein